MKKQVGITRQKNEFLSVSVRSILISFIIFSASCFDLSAQQSSGKVPYQVSKGKWMINNDFFYTGYFTEKNTSYDGNDNKTGRDKTGKFYSSISLISPSWGGLGINSGNTYKFDANDNELEKVDASNWSINITPSIGYFIQDRLLLGANILLYFGSDKSIIIVQPARRSMTISILRLVLVSALKCVIISEILRISNFFMQVFGAMLITVRAGKVVFI